MPGIDFQYTSLSLWQKHNRKIITLVFILFIILSGLYWHQSKQKSSIHEAAIDFQNAIILKTESPQKTDMLVQKLTHIKTAHPKTIYSDLSALWLAKINTSQNKLKEATHLLEQIIHTTPLRFVQEIASIRLTYLLLNQNQPQKALSVLNASPQIPSSSLKTSLLIAKGDVYLAQKDIKNALIFWKKAQKILLPTESPQSLQDPSQDELSLTPSTNNLSLLNMKINHYSVNTNSTLKTQDNTKQNG